MIIRGYPGHQIAVRFPGQAIPLLFGLPVNVPSYSLVRGPEAGAVWYALKEYKVKNIDV